MSILRQIPSECKIRTELKRILFGKTLFCPFCQGKAIKKYGKRYRCKRCRKPFSFTSVTWLRGMKLSLQTFWLLVWCWCNKVPVDQAHKVAGVSLVTVRRWYEKFRNHLPESELGATRLSGVIQIDEAYRGSKNKKYAIVGGKEIGTRKVVLKHIPHKSVDRRTAIDFLSHYVVPGSTLFSDGAAIYRKISNWWPVEHSYERHNQWEFALTSEIEGLWGNYTTFVRRMYHHVTPEKAPDLIKEFTFRFSHPEWFQSPVSYLRVAIMPLRKKQAHIWKFFPQVISPFEYANLPLSLAKKSLTTVPY